MAVLCPCGCGKKLGLIERGGAKQVRMLDERIEFLDAWVVPLSREADAVKLAEFINAGRSFQRQMLAVMHGELDARNVDRRLMNGWLKTAAKLERETRSTLNRA
jgi:hypothetical protein